MYQLVDETSDDSDYDSDYNAEDEDENAVFDCISNY